MQANSNTSIHGRDPCIVHVAGLAEALRFAIEHPECRVDAIEPTWEWVDRGREIVASLGLEARVWVRHHSAADVARRILGREITAAA